MKSPNKIVFEGFYGFQNTGDDAFIEVASWGSQHYWHCKNNAFIGTSLPTTTCSINSKHIVPNKTGLDRLNFASQLSNADYMISAGGSTFGNIPFHSNKAVGRGLSKLRSNLKLGAIGVSLGPFKSMKEEKEVIRYLKSINFLALRDQRSFDLAMSYQLPYTPVNAFDLAALLPQVYREQKSTTNLSVVTAKTIGISICNYERYTGGDLKKEQQRNAFLKELVRLIEKETAANFKVFIINGNSKIGDEAVTAALIESVAADRVTLIPYTSNIRSIWDEISNCDLMLSTRLHAGIFACYAEVPFLMVEYHKKCSDFLSDVGQNDNFRLYDAAIAPRKALEIVQGILEEGFKAPLYRNETIDRSAKNFTETIIL